MRKLLFAALALLPALALAVSPEQTRPIFDSTVVASGATWTSGALNLERVTHVEVFGDNTSGLGFRDLTMTSYSDPNCATTIESVVVQRIPYGTAPTGSNYAPGNVRGYVGPNPPAWTADSFVVGDTTTAANTAYSQDFFPQGAQNLSVRLWFSGAAASNPIVSLWDSEANIQLAQAQPGATATSMVITYGPSAGHGWSSASGGISMSAVHLLPRQTQFRVAAAGGGVTTRVRMVADGRVPGTFAHQMVLPVCAKFSLSAAGGTVRIRGIGR